MTEKTTLHVEIVDGMVNAETTGDEMSLVSAMLEISADILSKHVPRKSYGRVAEKLSRLLANRMFCHGFMHFLETGLMK